MCMSMLKAVKMPTKVPPPVAEKKSILRRMKSAGSKEEKTNSKPKKNSVTCNDDTNKNMDGIEDIKNVNASKRLSGSSFSVTSYTKKVTLPPESYFFVVEDMDCQKETVDVGSILDAGIYVGFANLPNQVHRKSVKRGFEFTLMVVGESGLGKSTLVESLFLTTLYADRQLPTASERLKRTVKITTNTVDIEEQGVRLKLTVVDTPGFGDSINNSESWSPIVDYIDHQYEAYLKDESGLNRRNISDGRVHCCLYFVNPAGHGLKPLDIQVMKALHSKVNIVPIIAKADTLTKAEAKKLKTRILKEIEDNKIQTYHFPEVDEEEDDEDFIKINKELKANVPFAVIGSTSVYEVNGKKIRGRVYPWGVVDIENPAHCDYTMLRNMIIRTHMQDLKDVTQDIHYENFRAQRLASGDPIIVKDEERKISNGVDDRDALLKEKEAELKRMQEMIAKMQEDMLKQQKEQQKLNGNEEISPQQQVQES